MLCSRPSPCSSARFLNLHPSGRGCCFLLIRLFSRHWTSKVGLPWRGRSCVLRFAFMFRLLLPYGVLNKMFRFFLFRTPCVSAHSFIFSASKVQGGSILPRFRAENRFLWCALLPPFFIERVDSYSKSSPGNRSPYAFAPPNRFFVSAGMFPGFPPSYPVFMQRLGWTPLQSRLFDH